MAGLAVRTRQYLMESSAIEIVCAAGVLQSNAVVAALAELFATFEAQEQQGSRNIVAPTRLREALDALNSHAFQIGAALSFKVHPISHPVFCPCIQ
jgi:hypothetical protein